jgi:glucose/arabinose dehydrogenase
MFSAQYRGNILIPERGSWNRLVPIGYRLTRVIENNGVIDGYEVFTEGGLHGMSSWGSPVDVLVMPDGALPVSDDKTNATYRISYSPPE